jgi:hypothetical protein
MLLATHSFPISSAFGAFILAIGWPLTPRRYSPFDKVEWDPFNRPHSRAVVEITSNNLLREVFSAKFRSAKALLHTTASPGKSPLHRYNRILLPCSVSGRHPLNKQIVCPKLRVSPLNAQTEFKVFSMQTAHHFISVSQLCVL